MAPRRARKLPGQAVRLSKLTLSYTYSGYIEIEPKHEMWAIVPWSAASQARPFKYPSITPARGRSWHEFTHGRALHRRGGSVWPVSSKARHLFYWKPFTAMRAPYKTPSPFNVGIWWMGLSDRNGGFLCSPTYISVP